jgi:hypothetical protein
MMALARAVVGVGGAGITPSPIFWDLSEEPHAMPTTFRGLEESAGAAASPAIRVPWLQFASASPPHRTSENDLVTGVVGGEKSSQNCRCERKTPVSVRNRSTPKPGAVVLGNRLQVSRIA